ncbi:MAG: MFS transporter [Acidobacteria bacterium]|nr:MFS transporter [Acidobacteriota bacterium]
MDTTTAPRPFSIPLFRRIWTANVASQFGGQMQAVGAAWLMVQLGASQTQIALVSASVTLPILLLALVAGAAADNYSRRRVMLMAQFAMFALSAVLCVLAWTGSLTPWLLLSFTFLIGCGMAMNAPSWQATVGDIVPRGTIAHAVAMNSMGFNIARSAGPAVGGAVVAAFGAAAAFTLNAISYLGLMAVLFRWRPAEPEKPKLRESLSSAMLAGIQYVALSPPIRRTMLRGALFGIGGGSVTSLMPLVARDLVQGGAATFGLLLGAFGAGAVIGALSSARLRARFTSDLLVRMSISVMILGAVTVALSKWLALTLLGLVFCGGGWLISVATMTVVVQMSAPRWVVGRAISLYQMAIFGAMALSSWTSGVLSENFGVSNAMLTMMAVQTAGLAIGFFFRLPEVDHLNLDPLDRWQIPSVKVDVEPRSGPIRVAIRYRISESDIPAFIAAMNERRRVRRRDGAKAWSLSRDLADLETWIEQYQFARWADYVRHNERRTHADDDNHAAIKSLHKGSWPPEIHRLLERQVSSYPVNAGPPVDTTIDPTRDA